MSVDELRLAAKIISDEIIIGFCAADFPITAEACQFCGATWQDKCGRANLLKADVERER